MSTFLIEPDAHGNFDSQYPIHLEGRVSPQEFNYIIQNANQFMHKRHKLGKRIIIHQMLLMVGFMIALGLIVWTAINLRNTLFAILAPTAYCIVYVFISVAYFFWMRKQGAKIIQELRSFIETNNQQIFYSRGVQFLVRTKMLYGYRRRIEHVYLEIVVSTNNQQIQQPPIYQQQVENQPLMKMYPQTVQPQYYG